MRLNKFIANCGYCSRRKADQLIASGKVYVNGKRVETLGLEVDETKDQVSVEGNRINIQKEHVYFVLNKPIGVTTTNYDPHADILARDMIPYGGHIANVGRLDTDSDGLVIYTTDGEFTYRMTHPKFEVWKTYRVEVNRPLKEEDLIILERGVRLEDGVTAPCFVNRIGRENTIIQMKIREGKNRQIRRMLGTLGYVVLRLTRLSHGDIVLGDLQPGKCREFNDRELDYVKKLVNHD